MSDAFVDPIATAIWSARAMVRPVEPPERIPLRRGNEIADALYARLRAEGARQIGWKIAATDPAVQQRFETDRPFVAPVYDVSVIQNGSRLSRGSLIAPILEAEIGVALAGTFVTVLPCIEIADCRVAGWKVTLAEAVADFGLQGAMLFGEPVDAVMDGAPVVTIGRDGEILARGTADLQAPVERARAIGEAYASTFEPGRVIVVATGAVLPPVPLVRGHWTVSFGPLGSLSLDVVD